MNYVIIENALSAELLSAITTAASSGPFISGKSTAKGLAQEVKKNLQLSSADYEPLLEHVAQSIVQHPTVQAFALPAHISQPMVNRYEAGMEYGLHADSAYINGMRTDVSFTLFLDDPASFQGGELVIHSSTQQFTFKLPAGSMVMYPSGALHRVTPVSYGTRNAVVGWVQSRIADAHKREIIARLNHVPRILSKDEQYTELATQTGQCIQDL